MKILARYILTFIFLIPSIFLAGCKSNTEVISSSDLALKVTQTVTSSSSAIVGIVKNKKGEPLVDISVKLAVVVWNESKTDGAYFLEPEHGPSTGTNPDGSFAIVDVPPNDYVLVIGDPMSPYAVVLKPDGDKAEIYTLEAGKVLNLGELRSDFIP